jgi:hypothetical protein
MAVGSRLPFLLLGVLSLVLLERFTARFYGDEAAAATLAIVACSAGLAGSTAHAVPAGLVMLAMVVLMAALDDHSRALQYDGIPPSWLFRTRSLACAGAVAVALATSYAFVPIVVLGLAWLPHRRRVVSARGDPVHPGAVGRALRGGVVVLLLLVLAYGVDYGSVLMEGDSHPALRAWCGVLGLDAPATAAALSEWSVPLPTWLRGLAHAAVDAGNLSDDARLDVALTTDGPLLAALALAGLGAWPMLNRDRADTPALLGVLGYGALGSALLLAPRHAHVAALAAIPPLAVLAASWLVRMGRHFRLGAVAVGVSIVAGVAGGWLLSPGGGPYAPTDAVPGPARVTAEDEWVVGRWIAAHAPERAVTLLGRAQRLRVIEGSRVDEVTPTSQALGDAAAALGRGANVAVLRGAWLPTPAVLRDESIPIETLGPRLIVHTRPPLDDR